MPLESIKGPLLRPGDYIQAQLKDRANRQDRLPGARFLAWYQVAMSVLVAVLAWASLGVLLALFKVAGWRLGWLWGLSQTLWAQSLSPVAMAIHLGEDLALSLISAWLLAELLDQAFRRLYGHAGGQQVLLFNAALRTTLPWALFLVVPVLGWIVMAVGTLWICFKVLGQVYAEKDPVKIVVAGVAALIPAAALSLLLALGMHLISGPLLQRDPLQPLLDRMLAWAERPLEARVQPQAMDAGAELQALRTAAAVAAQGPAGRVVEVPAPVAERQWPLVPAQAPAPARRAVRPRPARAPLAAAQSAAPAPAPVGAGAGDAPAMAAPAVAVVPTAAPTPEEGVGETLGKAAGREALRQGVGETVKLLRLFH